MTALQSWRLVALVACIPACSPGPFCDPSADPVFDQTVLRFTVSHSDGTVDTGPCTGNVTFDGKYAKYVVVKGHADETVTLNLAISEVTKRVGNCSSQQLSSTDEALWCSTRYTIGEQLQGIAGCSEPASADEPATLVSYSFSGDRGEDFVLKLKRSGTLHFATSSSKCPDDETVRTFELATIEVVP